MSEHQGQGPRFQSDFTAEEFASRRRNLTRAMGGPRPRALLPGAPTVPEFDAFRQSNDFYYLCGVEVPHAYLLLDADRGTATLYLPPRDAKHERNEGPTLCAEDGEVLRKWTAVDDVRPLAALPEDLRTAALLYLPHAPAEGARMCRDTLAFRQKQVDADPLNGRPSAEAHLIRRVRELCPSAEIRDLSPLLAELRLVKSPLEVAVLRRAGRLTAQALTEAMRGTRPGVMEYELGAVADYVFLVNGAKGAGYRAIIAGGANAWHAHYYRNDCPLAHGDLVLMDYAPDVANYTSDIGRMWPANGAYAPWQRELYGLVVEYHKALLALIRPGVLPETIMQEAADRMRPVIEQWRFSKPEYRQGALALLDFKGHLSHAVGMAVHEPCHYFGRPLEPGTVFAVDPQMWVPEEELYIRCEDTVAVTRDGCENLTALAPLDLDDVERVMREPGLLKAYPACET
jgi:Xaa-Pro aminopeptidase